jgi:C4-dicarboxylate-specific signal transduction histidine kinase
MFIGTIIDITEAKCAQESLLAMQSELARISQLTTIGQMAASIAHPPLFGIAYGRRYNAHLRCLKSANSEW